MAEMEVSSGLVEILDYSVSVSDTNQAMFPEDGQFLSIELSSTTHYRVRGNPISSQERTCTQVSPTSQLRPPAAPVQYRSQSVPGSSTSYLMQPHRSSGSKPVKRKIHLAALEGGNFRSSKILLLALRTGEFNVETVKEKIQEELQSPDAFILLDSGNKEVVDSAATRERAFWAMPSRILKAVSDVDFASFNETSSRAKKPKLAETTESLMEVEDTLLQLVECASAAAQKDKVSVMLPCSLADMRHLQDSLSCVICKDGIEKPVASACCKSLLGCTACLDEWWSTSTQCPKCRADNAKDAAINLCGLDNTFKLLKPITKM
ncbi:uncharacterized protein [Diadema antillarum]|uniref:uncharacterized protein n=1 Tax=Diadema antillarum TaxID=105358 RepID=UPI003A8C5924